MNTFNSFSPRYYYDRYDIPLYFVVMQNVCPVSVDEMYDLKGSWVARHGSKLNDMKTQRPKKTSVSAAAYSSGGGKKKKDKASLFLDNDIQSTISLHPEVAHNFARQIRRDIQLLACTYNHS